MDTGSTLSKGSSQNRLSREDWLRQALDVLSQEGESRVRVDGLSKALGVTKGSFYWHFENRADFLQAMLAYWIEHYNRRVIERAEAAGGNARERAWTVFSMVSKENLAAYDAAFDSWAAHEPGIAKQVRAMYKLRYEYVTLLFKELGHRGIELEMRATAFLTVLMAGSRLMGKARSGHGVRRLKAEFEFFVGE